MSIKISGVKETIYRNLFFFLYVTYLDTCSKTASVLPLACRELCHDKNEDHCLEYLRTDLSIQCHDSQYNNLAIIAYLSTVYVLALPVATFIILWRKRKDILMMADGEEGDNQGLGSEVTMGLQFLFENYKGTSWYWEFVEMSRKVIITSGLILTGQESRSYIGLAWVIAGIYGVFFAWNHPIQDAFENRLMTTSVAVTVFNLGIGSVSKIPSENVPTSTDSYINTFTFNILILGANTLVIALLAFEYFLHLYGYLKEWRKNPQWSFSCCLALVLPLISLPGDITGLANANMIRDQLDSGDVELPTLSGAVQDSGALDVSLEQGGDDGENLQEAQNENESDVRSQTVKKEENLSVDSAHDRVPRQGDLKTKMRTHNITHRAFGTNDVSSIDVTAHCRSNKCNQESQTEISTIFFISQLGVKKPFPKNTAVL